jgi:hypothetical protein
MCPESGLKIRGKRVGEGGGGKGASRDMVGGADRMIPRCENAASFKTEVRAVERRREHAAGFKTAVANRAAHKKSEPANRRF